MYSAARSKIFGIVHSPLVELSGVGGGRDPMLDTGINPPIAGVEPLALGFRYVVVVGVGSVAAPWLGY